MNKKRMMWLVVLEIQYLIPLRIIVFNQGIFSKSTNLYHNKNQKRILNLHLKLLIQEQINRLREEIHLDLPNTPPLRINKDLFRTRSNKTDLSHIFSKEIASIHKPD